MAGYTKDETSKTPLTTYFGTKMSVRCRRRDSRPDGGADDRQETDIALHAGNRGPTVLEDFHNREKISKFDHERIPERAVHARGAGAFGEFELHTPLTGITTAKVGLVKVPDFALR